MTKQITLNKIMRLHEDWVQQSLNVGDELFDIWNEANELEKQKKVLQEKIDALNAIEAPSFKKQEQAYIDLKNAVTEWANQPGDNLSASQWKMKTDYLAGKLTADGVGFKLMNQEVSL